MSNVEERAERDLLGLRQWVNRLLTLVNEILANIQYSEEDHLGFMALCFLSKQIDHMQSIVFLIPSRDAILVARSMIEGLCQLLWAAREPATLPLQWRAFAWVHDWRVMQAKMARGETVTPERRSAIENALQKYGDQFLTKKAKLARSQQTPLPPDPYHKDWRAGRQIRQIFESVEGEDLYRKLYEPFSDWQHWGAGGLGEAIARQGNRIVYSSLSSTDAATALAAAFQCLLQTIKVVDEHLGFGLTPKISELWDEYIAWYESY